MRHSFYYLSLLALVLTLTTTGCGNDDDGGPTFSEADLTIATGWGLTATSTNGVGQGAEIAALFTEQELMDNGYDSASELANELEFVFALLAVAPDPCITNNISTYLDNGTVDYDFSDDCGGGLVVDANIFNVDTPSYTWSLSGNVLTINGTPFQINTLNRTTLEIVLQGRDALNFVEFNIGDQEIDLTITYTYSAQ